MSKGMRTEDEVRDSAKLVLGFDKTEDGVQQGTGQITTFNQLGFRGCNDKPDGWYLPDDASKPAISVASYYTSMANVVLMHKDENNTRTQNIYEKLAEGTTYG